MDTIRTDSNIKRLTINDDPERLIEFDPTDVLFIEKFYQLYRDFEQKRIEFDEKSKALDEANKQAVENGTMLELEDGINFLREICTYMRGKIDWLFGDGTSDKAFGDSLSIDAIGQFFQGVSPYIWSERNDKVNKYSNTATKKRRAMK